VTDEEVVIVDRIVQEVLTRHGKDGSLLTILKEVQDKCAYLPEEAMIHIARGLGIPASEVYEVATFYSFLSADLLGENTIRICRSTPCFLKNSEIIVKTMEKELGISVGETTEDGKFSLLLTNCIGACDKAPAMMVNRKTYGNLTADKIARILSEYE
jgi:NADH:ubiquinone oxidoreductase subunit E